jgi:hypothetical protein
MQFDTPDGQNKVFKNFNVVFFRILEGYIINGANNLMQNSD